MHLVMNEVSSIILQFRIRKKIFHSFFFSRKIISQEKLLWIDRIELFDIQL